MGFQLTDDQNKALEMVKSLMKLPHDKPRIGILRGWAGTGKTTLIRVLGHEVGGMAIIAPTGKAATRVKEATGLDASTIHRFIYAPKEDPYTGEVKFLRKDVEEISCPQGKLIVIEEASMVPRAIWEDIYSVAILLGCHILCVGDPYQLPPVETKQEKLANDLPFGLLLPTFPADLSADLKQITRQALESPIVRASLKLREGDVVSAALELPRVRPDGIMDAHLEILKQGGVVICHRNDSRNALNTAIRQHRNLPEKSLAEGEPLLVTRNNYILNRFNGEVLTFDRWKRLPGRQWEIYDRFTNKVDSAAFGHGIVEGEEVALVPKAIRGRLDMTPNAIELVSKAAIGNDIPYLHCNFGYTLTAHKSQGSEWDNVMVIVERSVRPFSREGCRWLYTATTRGKKEVSLVWLAGANDPQII